VLELDALGMALGSLNLCFSPASTPRGLPWLPNWPQATVATARKAP
jgi:hypothetical protein